MDEVSQYIAYLIFKYRWQELSGEEQRQLKTWLTEDAGNRVIFENLLKDESNSAAWHELKKYDSRKAFRVFARDTGMRKRSGYIGLWVAAVALVALFSGFWVFYQQTDISGENIPVIAQYSSVPDHREVMVTLENGKKLTLEQLARDSVLKQKNIRVDSACLVYACHSQDEQVKYNTIEVPAGAEYTLVLSDGTRVWLNSQSRLTYPVMFTGKERVVELEGEAFFEVRKDTTHSFRVKAGDVGVRVLGTSFNVKAYGDENQVATTLVEGRVMLESGRQSVAMRPGEQVVYNRENCSLTKRKVDVELYVSWKAGVFKFERVRLEEILHTLGRWYGMEIFYVRPVLKDQLFSGSLKRYRNIDDVLRLLEMTMDLHFDVNENTIVVN